MILPTLDIEISLWQKGHRYIAGIDEVGRGSWAGPMVAAGVILPVGVSIPKNLADSKLLTPKIREELSKIIKKIAVGFFICEVSSYKIDRLGLARSANIAFRAVIGNIKPRPDFCLIDAFYIKYFSKKKQMAVRGGDKICASIAAASIIAKVYRDDLMRKLHVKYPQYGFSQHKGYGTRLHQAAIRRYGFCKIHRTSYNLNFLT